MLAVFDYNLKDAAPRGRLDSDAASPADPSGLFLSGLSRSDRVRDTPTSAYEGRESRELLALLDGLWLNAWPWAVQLLLVTATCTGPSKSEVIHPSARRTLAPASLDLRPQADCRRCFGIVLLLLILLGEYNPTL